MCMLFCLFFVFSFIPSINAFSLVGPVWAPPPRIKRLPTSVRCHTDVTRRDLVARLPAAASFLLASSPSSAEETISTSDQTLTPVGYRATNVVVGGQIIPIALWYPLSDDDSNKPSGSQPYRYRIGIRNLFKVFLGLDLPFIPNPEVLSGDTAVRVDGTPKAQQQGGIVFAHGMLGSRFDMADLCAALASRGFVVSSADFAESISASFTPNEGTTREAIIEAEMALLARDFGASLFGIVGHSAGGGSATTVPGPFALGRCAVAGARPYRGTDPLYLVASAGDGVVPLDRVREAVPPNAAVTADPAAVRWDNARRAGALLIEGPVGDASHAPNHISFLDEEANAALVRVLAPLLPLARFLKLPVLDFDVYTERKDARQTAAAVRPSIVSFFVAQTRQD